MWGVWIGALVLVLSEWGSIEEINNDLLCVKSEYYFVAASDVYIPIDTCTIEGPTFIVYFSVNSEKTICAWIV